MLSGTISLQRFVRVFRARCFSTVRAAVGSSDIAISEEGRKVDVSWEDGGETRLNSVWLRHNCRCPECFDRITGQKTVPVRALYKHPRVETAVVKGERIEFQWKYSDAATSRHSGFLDMDWLRDNCVSKTAQEKASITPSNILPKLSYADIGKDEQSWIWKYLKNLNEHGKCLVLDLPPGELNTFVDKFSWFQRNLYGETFDVVATPTPTNLAYGISELQFHQDLVFYESVPGLQLFHCIKFDECVTGGESLLVDGLAAAEELRRSYPQHFETLSHVPCTFHRVHFDRKIPSAYYYQRTHIVVDKQKQITAISCNPSLESGPLLQDEDLVEAYYDAYTCFHQLLLDSPTKLTHRLVPGELLTINNRRIFHARNSFVLNGGIRHLLGCYVNIDDFRSAVEVYKSKNDKSYKVKRVFNHSSL